MKSKFAQIADQLLADIDSGRYTGRLPSEQELAKIFGTTAVTVRKGLDQLFHQGVIEKVPYVGTFVRRRELPVVRIFWPDAPFAREENEAIINAVTERFASEIKVEFCSRKRDDETRFSYDLLRVTGTLRCPYGEVAAPLSPEYMEEFMHPGYFRKAFDVHRLEDMHYALPLLFSPSLLQLDRSLLPEGFPCPEPYGLSWEFIFKLKELAVAQGWKLWDASAMHTLMRCLVLESCDEPGRLADVNIERMERNIRRVWPLFDPALMITSPGEQVLLKWTCRQYMVSRNASEAPVLLAFPPESQDGVRYNAASGEFMMLAAGARERDAALSVAKFFLSEKVQGIIGRYKVGLPVLKSAALDSIDSRLYRDDMFINEERNIMANNAAEHEFVLRLRTHFESVINSKMSLESFLDMLKYEVNTAKRRNLDNDIWTEQQYYGLTGI